ncbi:hypothetical protein CRG98_013913 [Punica granatum]|uniref:Retrotransposon gag domain-containing protein n=1 Tax=Punica granatum TaxID=22663 RepID=A0A2I0KAX7_PUNGR|nr:hypothetical protein CRG98_013913 [Punica granatum]
MAKDHPERVPRGLTFDQDLLPTLKRTNESLAQLERIIQAIASSDEIRRHQWVQKDYPPKRIPTFNGSMSAEEFFTWISDVDRFFDYYGIPDDGSRVVRVVYRLRGKASTWWEKLENNRLQDGRNLVFTWRHMKQLLKILAVVLDIRQTCIRQRMTPFEVHILVPAYRTMGANSGYQSYSTAIMKMCKEV